jgi:hypothetical protein
MSGACDHYWFGPDVHVCSKCGASERDVLRVEVERLAEANRESERQYQEKVATVIALTNEVDLLKDQIFYLTKRTECWRWNVERGEGNVLRICDGDHEKSDPCHYVDYVPASELHSARKALEDVRQYVMNDTLDVALVLVMIRDITKEALK